MFAVATALSASLVAPIASARSSAVAPPRLVDIVAVSSQDPDGVDVSTTLKGSSTYVLVATGRYDYGPGGSADVECSDGGSSDRRLLRERHGPSLLDLLVNHQDRDWRAIDPDANGCSPRNAYQLVLPIAQDGTVNLRIDDAWHGDNLGSVSVAIFRLCGATKPAQCEDEIEVPIPKHPYPIPHGMTTLIVDSSDPLGTTTAQPLVAGRTYDLYASGEFVHRTYSSVISNIGNSNRADAECYSDGVLRQFSTYPGASTLDLEINGVAPEWAPATTNAECDPTHTYRLTLTPEVSGPLTARIDDTSHHDNSGHLVLTVIER